MDVPVTRELPVQIDWAGKLAKDLILERADLDPLTVKIVGGSRILGKIATIYTEPVSLDTIEASGTLAVGLSLQSALLKTAPNTKDKVTVSYTVGKR